MPVPGSNFNDSGTVTDDETVTAYSDIWNSDDTCNSDLSSCPNVDYEVKVTWQVQCWGRQETLSTTNTVDAPSTWAQITDPSLTGALASATFTVPSSLCDPGYDNAGGVGSGEFSVSVYATVISTGGVGGIVEANQEIPSVAAAQLIACDCSTDSADPGSEAADAGDPVDTVSGAYAESVTDASLQAPGYPLTISRSYSSADTVSGTLGPGWSVPWGARLSIASSTGDVTFTAENGDQYVYLPNGSGGFQTPAGARSVLAAETNSSGGVTGYTLTDLSDHIVLTFNATGRLESAKDATGRGLTLAYNSSGLVSSITDAAGHVVSLSYSGSLLTKVALPDGQDITYGYNTSDQLTSVTDPGGAAWQYTYNSAGLLATVTDPDHNQVVQNTYNASKEVTEQKDGDENATSFSYTTTSGGLAETDVTAPDGGITSYLYAGGMLLEQIGPVGDATTDWVYDIFGQPSEAIDPLGRVTEYVYDGSGDLTEETSNLGYEQQWTYDNASDVLTYQDADTNTMTYTYNSMDEVLTATAQDGEETQYTYNSNGALATGKDPRGKTTTYSYLSDGMLGSATDPDSETTSYSYDSMGSLLAVTSPLKEVTTYTYNDAEQVASATVPGGAVTKYGYDADGQLTSREDPGTNTWTYTYDADGHLTKATDPLKNSDSFVYDGDGDVKTFTDARQEVTTTSYNLADLPTEIGYSDGTPSVSYAYDADGEVTSVTDGTVTQKITYDGDGEVTGDGAFSYGYDDAGNLTSRTYPDKTQISYGYNGDEQVSSMTVGSAQTTYSYNADGDLTSTADPDGVTETRGYDNADQLTSITDATSAKTLDSYGLTLNAAGEPTAVAVTQGGTTQPTQYYGYDPAGQLTSACYTTSAASACSAAAAGTATGSATGVTAAAGAGSAVISWTPVSGATAYTVTASPGGATATTGPYATSATVSGLTAGTAYTFKLAAATSKGTVTAGPTTAITPGNEVTYGYAPAGNLTSTETDGVTTTGSYNADEELTSDTTGSTTVSYGYDADGNQTTAGSNTYTYNAAGELTGGKTPAGSFSYGYNGSGDLATTSFNGTEISATIWDLNNPLPEAAEDTTSAGSVTDEYGWNPDGTLNSETQGGATGTGTTYDAVTNWESSLTGLVNSSGAQVSSTTYGPYGTSGTSGTPSSSIGYAGSYTLPGSGLDDMRARDYNPATGSFTSVDPALAITGQPYSYVSGDPVGGTDPSGLKGWGLCLSGLLEGGAMATASACLNVTFNIFTGEVQFGGTFTPGGGLGMVGGSGGISLQGSNANQISDLGGPFGMIGGSVGALPDIGGGAFTGQGACNQQITGGETFLGVGTNLAPIPGWEMHSGVTYTFQSTFFSFNLYSIMSDIGSGYGRGADNLSNDFTSLLNPRSWF
jgi:RHS repeat-associated protein